MKTAISVPDEVFTRVEAQAATMGVSRSGFYSIAAQRFLEDLGRGELTRQINEAIAMDTSQTGTEAVAWSDAALREVASRSGVEDW